MRYWVYINDKVEGPYEEDKLVTLPGFGPDTLICSEEIEAGGSQEWVKASGVFEFDPLQNTINQPFPVQEDLQTAPMPYSANAETAPETQTYAQPASGVSSDVSNILIEKLDKLTQEIESLKSKLDEAITAGAMTKTAAELPRNFVDSDSSAQTITLTQADIPADHVQEDALITSTASLVSQAESLIAEAKSADQPEEKPVDFLQTVDLGATQTDHIVPSEEPLPKEGEEVILRSALDSLYNAKIQSEEEKEATFQDLLTPKQAEDLQKAVQQPAEHTATLDEALKEDKPTQEPAKEETPSPTEAEKDAFLKELTDHPQEDVISKLIEEKQGEAKEGQNEFAADAAALAAGAAAAGVALAAMNQAKDEPAQGPVQPEEQPRPVQEEQTPAIAEPIQEEPAQAAADLPSADIMPESAPEPEPVSAEKQDLNLEGQPELNIAEDLPSEPEAAPVEQQDLNLENQPELNITQTPADEPAQPLVEEVIAQAKQEEQPQAEPVFSGNKNDLPSLEEAARQALPAENQDQHEETLQELVPGAKMEAPDRNAPLTEADLRETFAERPAVEEMTVAQDLDAQLQEEQPLPEPADAQAADITPLEQTTSTESLPMGEGNFNPNDLTEIELKEGSTYLISDFVPPAQANEVPRELGGLKNVQRDDLGGGKVQGADVLNVDPNVKTQTISDGIEEMMPASKHQENTAASVDQAVQEGAPDVTISKVILENTIKTKRGASLDIKTVPMVPEPSQTGRLDLGNTDLEDINAQHDLKTADIKPAGGMTKVIIGGLVSVVILAVIYVMLAFLNLIPAQYNLINSAPAKSDQEQTAQLNEMLGQEPATTVAGSPSAPVLPQQQMPMASPMQAVIAEVQNYPLPNGMTLRQLIEARHPAMRDMIEWDATTAVDPDNYSILVKVPPENPQSFKISYRFNYNTLTRALDPTISDSKNLLDSVRGTGMPQQPVQQQPAPMR